jgi:hypothetical protein
MILVKPAIMKHPAVYKLSIVGFALLVGIFQASARPIDFNEVSLLVRAGENEGSIRQEVAQRRLMHALTPQQEGKLKAQGATDSLVQALRNPNLVISKEEAATLEAQGEQKAHAVSPLNVGSTTEQTAQGKLYVFDVALGHPINLSQWGGYDYELAFYSYRSAGEDIIEPVMIDNVRTGSIVSRVVPSAGLSEDEIFGQDNGLSRDWYPRQRFSANDSNSHRFTPYDARSDLKDDRFNFSDTVSVSSHSASRTLAIDWSNPVTVEGVPYALYPVYGAGGVTLYYIAGSSSSVRLAVATR